MHSFGHGGNALLACAVAFLALMCALACLSDHLLNSPSPTAQIQVLNIDWFQKQSSGNDEVSITMNISADLKSLFTWNTKQISLWDGIIPSKKDAEFWVRTSNKYDFIDQGRFTGGKQSEGKTIQPDIALACHPKNRQDVC